MKRRRRKVVADGTDGRTDIEGSTRGPHGPKKTIWLQRVLRWGVTLSRVSGVLRMDSGYFYNV